ncbi:MAG: gamma-glutamylcyclotransferase [Cyanobacteria bacterium J06638_7]
MRVAVYGTLKRGECNHQWLRGARFEGRTRVPGLELYTLGAYPMAVPSPDPSASIHAEVYGLDEAGLNRLDVLEDYPALYDRRRLATADGGLAWLYLGRPQQVRGRRRVPFDDWGATPVFSYGSNLDPQQLRQRCGGWDGLGLVARLDHWQWQINKRALHDRQEGFAGIVPRRGASCWGLVHHLRHRDRAVLDLLEGVGIAQYRHQEVQVVCGEERLRVLTYVPHAAVLSGGLRPSPAYAARVLRGARHHGLPSAWCSWLRQQLGEAAAAQGAILGSGGEQGDGAGDSRC